MHRPPIWLSYWYRARLDTEMEIRKSQEHQCLYVHMHVRLSVLQYAVLALFDLLSLLSFFVFFCKREQNNLATKKIN